MNARETHLQMARAFLAQRCPLSAAAELDRLPAADQVTREVRDLRVDLFEVLRGIPLREIGREASGELGGSEPPTSQYTRYLICLVIHEQDPTYPLPYLVRQPDGTVDWYHPNNP